MKNFYMLISLLLLVGTLSAQSIAQGFEFPSDQVDEPFNANLGTEQNQGYDIRMEDITLGNDYSLTLVEGFAGEGDFAVSATAWNDGAEEKLMSIKLKGDQFYDFSVSFVMKSETALPGPKDWKIVYQLSGGEWTDVPEATFSIDETWETGTVVDIALPVEANNPESSLYIGWVPITNESITGGDVAADGVVVIDNIYVTAFAPALVATFNVDMTNAENFDPAADVVLITGSMFDWAEPGSELDLQTLTDEDGDMIYSVDVEVAAGEQQYKYFLNPGWDGGEWEGEPNRVETIEESTVIDNVWGSMNGIATITELALNVYPNPASEALNIETESGATAITMYDIAGKMVYQNEHPEALNTISVAGFAKGLYIVSVAYNGQTVNRKIAVR